MGNVAVLEGEEGEGVGLAVDGDGKIIAVGLDSEIDAALQGGWGKLAYSMHTHAHCDLQVVLLIT